MRSPPPPGSLTEQAQSNNQIRRRLEEAFVAFVNDPEPNMIKLAEWMEIYVARSKSAR